MVDVVVNAAQNIDRQSKDGKLAAATGTDFARSGIGVAVPASAAKVDVSTSDAFESRAPVRANYCSVFRHKWPMPNSFCSDQAEPHGGLTVRLTKIASVESRTPSDNCTLFMGILSDGSATTRESWGFIVPWRIHILEWWRTRKRRTSGQNSFIS
jgi:hypothetical protein